MSDANTHDALHEIGWAVKQMWDGHKVRRRPWPINQSVFLVQGSSFEVSRAPLSEHYPKGAKINYLPHVDMDHGGLVGVYSFTQGDVLSVDWELSTN